jgi:hypothetical protein
MEMVQGARKVSAMAQANEHAFVSRALRPVTSTPTALISGAAGSVMRRSMRNLEVAIGALSVPFTMPSSPLSLSQRARKGDGGGNDTKGGKVVDDGKKMVRESSMDSSDTSLTDGSVSMHTGGVDAEYVITAEEMVQNARRKQSILIGIMIKLQAQCRVYLARQALARLRSEYEASRAAGAAAADAAEAESARDEYGGSDAYRERGTDVADEAAISSVTHRSSWHTSFVARSACAICICHAVAVHSTCAGCDARCSDAR